MRLVTKKERTFLDSLATPSGDTGQAILKLDSDQYNASWGDVSGGGGGNFSNGLQIDPNASGNIVLGGTLNQDTDIELAGNAITIEGDNTRFNFGTSFSVAINDEDGNNSEIQLKPGTVFISGSGVNGSNQTISWGGSIAENSFMIVSDGANLKGLEAAADYSANFTDNSYVTKSWVLAQIASAIAALS